VERAEPFTRLFTEGARAVRDGVAQAFGITLVPEVNLVGIQL